MFTEGNNVECTARFCYAAELPAIYMKPVYMEVRNRALEKLFREKSNIFLNLILNIDIFFIFFDH